MIIVPRPTRLHWNYFLALEQDLEKLARYIEFSEANLEVYSIELAHVLFAAASEVDVVAKLLCAQLSPDLPRRNIDDYREALTDALPTLPTEYVYAARYGLVFQPWSSFTSSKSPAWWRSYNNVKHERDVHFPEATLKNALSALGALLILLFHYYSRELASNPGEVLAPKDATRHLSPGSSLLKLNPKYYRMPIVF